MGHSLTNDADILIVGGGLSGAMLAAQLMRRPGRCRVLVIEPRAELGRGVAYSAVELGHTLNGNAARVSLDPDNADDFTQWLTEYIEAGGWPESDQQHVPVGELFPPRGIFGLYACQRLADAQALGALNGSTVEHVQAEVVDLQTDADAVRLTLNDGRSLQGTSAVLATGVFPAARTPQTRSSGLNAAALDPWDVGAMQRLDPLSTVMIIGSGLTMVDAVVSLDQAGHRGPIEVFSRHGLRPHVRRQAPAWVDFLAQDQHIRTPRQLMRELRRHCRDAIAQGIDWQAPLNMVRPHFGRLWHQATDAQRRQFVRHVRPWWESHHHRSSPLSAELVERLYKEGRLRIHAASFEGLERSTGDGVSIRLRRRGEAHTCVVSAGALINSSGIEYDWRRVARPLPRHLLARGLVRPGPLALGIAADVDGAVLNAEGQPASRLFAMGPPLRGMWWESTAISDVVSQARALAGRLVR
jgi:uncharacterized NAD(P)/FAD-binding protein YdhS